MKCTDLSCTILTNGYTQVIHICHNIEHLQLPRKLSCAASQSILPTTPCQGNILLIFILNRVSDGSFKNCIYSVCVCVCIVHKAFHLAWCHGHDCGIHEFFHTVINPKALTELLLCVRHCVRAWRFKDDRTVCSWSASVSPHFSSSPVNALPGWCPCLATTSE